MLTSQTTERRDSPKPTELKREDREFVKSSLGEVMMYFVAIGLVVGLGLLLSSGIEHLVAFFKKMIDP